MDQIELERLGIAEAVALLQGKRALAEAERLRVVALQKRIEQVRPRVLEEREKSGLREDGSEGSRFVRRTHALDNYERELGDVVREARLAGDRQRGLAGEVGALEAEVGQLETFWQQAGGDEAAYQKRLDEAVEEGFATVRDSRDSAQAEYERSEASAFELPDSAPLFERMAKQEAQRYRSTVVTAPPSWGHFAPALQALARSKGYRLARAVQARLWQSGDIPAGHGLL